MKNIFKIFFLILLTGLITTLFVIYHIKILEILRNRFDGLATIFSAFIVIAVYYIEQRSKKINAARLVLKEIDAAIPIAQELAIHKKYDQKAIVIATDNWPNQIHFFATDMTEDEIKQINKIYSNGRYINKCIEKVDEFKKTGREKIYQEERDKPENHSKNPEAIFNDPAVVSRVDRVGDVANALIIFAADAADEIKDAQGWAGYHKLRQIAGLK